MTLGIWVKRTLTPKAVLSDTSDADISLGAALLRLPLQAGELLCQRCVVNCTLKMPVSFWWH